MRRATLSIICVGTILGIVVMASAAMAETKDQLLNVSVAFGRGLNTAQPGNLVNHVILPDEIKIKQGGVVHFLVAGFHQIIVYKPGIGPEDIDVPAGGTFIDDPIIPDPANQFYLGINPAGGPPDTPATPVIFPGPPPPADDGRSNASNRVETVSFPATVGVNRMTGAMLSEKAEPGVYLVICNVRGHFNDGMYAFVRVLPSND